MTLDPERTLAELEELQRLTGNDRGAQRVAWTPVWAEARLWLEAKLEELPLAVEHDEAGNLWATLPGQRRDTILLCGHLDSVPDGGWLDGALDTLASLACLRRLAAEPEPPPLTVALVDWADEEGVQFGRSLIGSSAASGVLDLDELATLRSRDGEAAAALLARYGVELERMLDCGRRLENAVACVELHIEQGPVLEALGLPLGVVTGTYGVERHAVRFLGQAAHAGSTPMDQRRDAFLAAARLGLRVREIAGELGGVGTVGAARLEPGIPTAIPGCCEILVDQRHAEADDLRAALACARAASEEIARDEGVEVAWRRIWRTEPISFDPGLLELAEGAVLDVAGACHRLASGPLHDAAEPARAGVPTVMLFVQSLGGLSHCKEEDSRRDHLATAVRALDRTVARILERHEEG